MCKPNVIILNGSCCEDALRNALQTKEVANLPVQRPNVAMGKVDGHVIVVTDDREMAMLLSGCIGWRASYGKDVGAANRIVIFNPPHRSIRQVLAQIAEKAGEPATAHRV